MDDNSASLPGQSDEDPNAGSPDGSSGVAEASVADQSSEGTVDALPTGDAGAAIQKAAKPLPPRSELLVRKSNEAIGLRVVEGQLTLLNRKIFNVLMYHAQRLKEPGVDAPIETPSADKYFWVPLSVMARDASYDSRDMAFLREQIEKMQNIKLKLETDRQWTSERLIASITIVNPAGLNSKKGRVWLGFAFPPEVYTHVMSPEKYTRLSIQYQGSLKSGPALALYELCRRFATNPSKVTAIYSYESCYGMLTGSPVPSNPDELPEYKYFKRDVIKRAIAEVNQNTDITVELIEHKVFRRVQKLQFRVDFAKRAAATPDENFVVDTNLLEKLMQSGLKQAVAMERLARHSPEAITKALAFIADRSRDTQKKRVQSKAGYLLWALDNADQLPAKQDAAPPPAAPQGKAPTLLERFTVARANLALEVFMEMDLEQRAEVYASFKAQSTAKVPALDKVLNNGIARTNLSLWYAATLWGEPTVDQLSHFSDHNEIPR